jgi:hypothetical protein
MSINIYDLVKSTHMIGEESLKKILQTTMILKILITLITLITLIILTIPIKKKVQDGGKNQKMEKKE